MSVKPQAGPVVQKSFSKEDDKKTPFAILRVRCANCTKVSKRRTSKMGLNDIHSLVGGIQLYGISEGKEQHDAVRAIWRAEI